MTKWPELHKMPEFKGSEYNLSGKTIIDAAVAGTRIKEAIRVGGLDDIVVAFDGLAGVLGSAVEDNTLSEELHDSIITLAYSGIVLDKSDGLGDITGAKEVIEALGEDRRPKELEAVNPDVNSMVDFILE